MLVLVFFFFLPIAAGIMATRPRRLRNLNLEDEDDAEPF
jgi:hypothetical protein